MALFKRNKNPLKYSRELYTVPGLAKDIPNIREEYRRLREMAEDRLRKFKKAGLADTEIYKYNKQRFDPARSLTDAQIAERMGDLARFITAKRGTVGGFRAAERKAVETLQAEDLEFVNIKNFRDFAEFMESARAAEISNAFYKEASAPDGQKFGDEKILQTEVLRREFNKWLEEKKA